MRKSRFTDEQIVAILREADRDGVAVVEPRAESGFVKKGLSSEIHERHLRRCCIVVTSPSPPRFTVDMPDQGVPCTRDGLAIAEGRGIAAARLRAIMTEITANLGDGDLSVVAIARRHRVTPRYIHKLFDNERPYLLRIRRREACLLMRVEQPWRRG